MHVIPTGKLRKALCVGPSSNLGYHTDQQKLLTPIYAHSFSLQDISYSMIQAIVFFCCLLPRLLQLQKQL